MTYSPHIWQPGEIISSARLNALEQGVAAGGGAPDILVNITELASYRVEDIEIVCYDHDAFVSKILNGEPVFGYAYHEYPYNDNLDGCSNCDMMMSISNCYLDIPSWWAELNLDEPITDPKYIRANITFQQIVFNPNINTKQITNLWGRILNLSLYKVLDSSENISIEYTFSGYTVYSKDL